MREYEWTTMQTGVASKRTRKTRAERANNFENKTIRTARAMYLCDRTEVNLYSENSD